MTGAADPQLGLASVLVKRGRIAVVAVLILAALDWVGWATGVRWLTRIYPTWPQMTPWTALLLAMLGAAILLQSGTPSPAQVWAGRALAAAAGVFAVMFLAAHSATRPFGLDQLFFAESVRALPLPWPGRPSPQTAWSVLFISVAIALNQTNQPWIRWIRVAFQVAAMAAPVVTLTAYLFDPPELIKTAKLNGMAVTAAMGLVLLGSATLLVRPDRGPARWWLSQPNRWSMFRMGVVVASFPLLVGLSRHIFLALGYGLDSALALSTAVGTVLAGISMFFLSRHEQQLMAANESERALLRAQSDGMLDLQVLLESVRDPDGRVVDFVIRSANRALCTYLGVKEEDVIGFRASKDPRNFDDTRLMDRYVQCIEDGQPVIIDDVPRYGDVEHELRRYDIRINRAGPTLLSVTWSDVTERFEAAARIREAEERYRRSIDNAAIGMCIVTPDDRFEAVNKAMCDFLGYDAETLMRMNWKDLTAPEYLKEDLEQIRDIRAGRKDSFRLNKQFIHADGHRVWGDLSVSCVRDGSGRVERFISQVVDITAAVEATERSANLARRLAQERERLAAELRSAAAYMSSIMPRGLTGTVDVASYYLPSRALGGDCFDYTWIDDDHLLIYLIDVSGHGLEPALLSVSVHNLIRSGSVPIATLFAPDALLTELNRLFQMEQQSDHYFTMWCGVYQESTRTLRYSSGGATPAIALNRVESAGVVATELSTDSVPLGMFEDSTFVSSTYPVPPGCRILIASDGATEIDLADGGQLSFAGFTTLLTEMPGSPNWSLDALIANLRALTQSGFFEDDCALIKLTFD